ncbi:hypothetical protein J7E62_01645 [Variovorax paradoxus]|nr:hypothetical protein [Variovorax paradoxus]
MTSSALRGIWSPKARVLYEIRLCWSDQVFPDQAHSRGGLWMPDVPHNREKLEHAAAMGNRLHVGLEAGVSLQGAKITEVQL